MAARLAHKMAIVSDKVVADVIEATEFPEYVQKYRVSGVPKTVINDKTEFVGGQPESRFLQYVLKAVNGKAG